MLCHLEFVVFQVIDQIFMYHEHVDYRTFEVPLIIFHTNRIIKAGKHGTPDIVMRAFKSGRIWSDLLKKVGPTALSAGYLICDGGHVDGRNGIYDRAITAIHWIIYGQTINPVAHIMCPIPMAVK